MTSRRALVVPALVVGALVAQALAFASPASAATVRFAAPTGSGTTCATAAPCDLVTAVNSASTGDEVVVAPGTYTTSVPLGSDATGLRIHGAVGQPRPVINSSAASAISIGQSGVGTQISDLTINHTGASYGLNVFAKSTLVERVQVRTTGAVACSPGITGILRDSLCVTSAPGGIAIDNSWSGDSGFTLNIRNVTAIATGAASYGIRADAAGDRTDILVDARNVIASGTAADLRSTETGSNSESRIFVLTSNFDSTEESGGGDVDNPSYANNQTAPPIFAETTSYRQAIGSPTIDKGGRSNEVGNTTDLDGEPRVTGAAVDIGVDELDVTAPDTAVVKPTKKKLRKRKVKFQFIASEPASFVCAVDKKPSRPCAATYKKKMKRYGKHKITVHAVDVVGNVDPTPVVFKFKVKKKKKQRKG